MKFTFAAACLLGVTLADHSSDQEFALADDSGLDDDNLRTASVWEDQSGFDRDWGVCCKQDIIADPEDGEGWEIHNSFEEGGAELYIYKSELYDQTIFEGSNGVVFNVGVAGVGPDYTDWFDVRLQVTCEDGTVIEQRDSGYATEELKKIRLEADTTSCDITNVKVSMKGKDAEYWAGTYGASWKDMDLYVWKEGPEPNYSLLDDKSEWSTSMDTDAVFSEDPVDGIGKEIQFSYFYGAVSASTQESDHADADFNRDVLTQLNFDVNVRGCKPNYKDKWKVTVEFLDVDGNTLLSDQRSGEGTQAGEDVHMEWDTTALALNGDFDIIEVTLKSNSAEIWVGNYGVIFRGMDLYLSEPTDPILLASKAASSSDKNFNAGFMAGLGASAAVMGVAAFVMLNRKKSAIEDGAFERV